MEGDGVGLHDGHEDVVLYLLHDQVQDHHRDDALHRVTDRQRDEQRGDHREDGADDGQQLGQPGHHRQQDGEVAEARIHREGEDLEAHEGRHADDQAEQHLCSEPAAEDAVDDAHGRPDVAAPRGGDGLVEGGGEAGPVLQQVKGPDRDDDEAEERAKEPDHALRQGHECARVQAFAGLAGACQQAVHRAAHERGQLRREIPVLECGQEGRRVRRELADLPHQGTEQEGEALDEDGDGHDVDEQHGQCAGHTEPPHPYARQAVDGRIHDVDQDQAQYEGTQRASRHVEDDAEQDDREDHQRGSRRGRAQARRGIDGRRRDDHRLSVGDGRGHAHRREPSRGHRHGRRGIPVRPCGHRPCVPSCRATAACLLDGTVAVAASRYGARTSPARGCRDAPPVVDA